MSLYASYLQERTSDGIIENDEGFITFRYLNRNQVYIIDVYVLPEYRGKGIATELADKVCATAKTMGCTEVIGSVVPAAKGATESISVLIAYGMNVFEASQNLILFKKVF